MSNEAHNHLHMGVCNMQFPCCGDGFVSNGAVEHNLAKWEDYPGAWCQETEPRSKALKWNLDVAEKLLRAVLPEVEQLKADKRHLLAKNELSMALNKGLLTKLQASQQEVARLRAKLHAAERKVPPSPPKPPSIQHAAYQKASQNESPEAGQSAEEASSFSLLPSSSSASSHQENEVAKLKSELGRLGTQLREVQSSEHDEFNLGSGSWGMAYREGSHETRWVLAMLFRLRIVSEKEQQSEDQVPEEHIQTCIDIGHAMLTLTSFLAQWMGDYDTDDMVEDSQQGSSGMNWRDQRVEGPNYDE
ncbi:unnamed protein product, partial [Symbiodinium sp. CCMP2456]